MVRCDRAVPSGAVQPPQTQDARSGPRVGIGIESLFDTRELVRVIEQINLKASNVDHGHTVPMQIAYHAYSCGLTRLVVPLPLGINGPWPDGPIHPHMHSATAFG